MQRLLQCRQVSLFSPSATTSFAPSSRCLLLSHKQLLEHSNTLYAQLRPRAIVNKRWLSLIPTKPLLQSLPSTQIQQDNVGVPATYSPPQTGLISKLPSSWVPYAELIRLDKPAGTYYLYSPCLFATLMAAPLAVPSSTPLEVLSTAGLFFAGALIMRGAGCTINDLWDRNLDPQVERTRFRPIARKAITPRQAIVYLGFQLMAGLSVLLQFPTQCFFYATPSLILVTLYPLAKRVTNYPQFVLGLTFSWGAVVGFPALGVDLLSNHDALMASALLYASCVTWTLNYDMIYAYMDIKDDVKAGIKSIARAHDHNAKPVLYGLSVVQVGLLAAAGVFSGAGPIFFVGSCGGALITLTTMVRRVNLKDVKDCWWWFRNGALITGGTISAGLFGDYLYRRQQLTQIERSETKLQA